MDSSVIIHKTFIYDLYDLWKEMLAFKYVFPLWLLSETFLVSLIFILFMFLNMNV